MSRSGDSMFDRSAGGAGGTAARRGRSMSRAASGVGPDLLTSSPGARRGKPSLSIMLNHPPNMPDLHGKLRLHTVTVHKQLNMHSCVVYNWVIWMLHAKVRSNMTWLYLVPLLLSN